ncbi:MAG: SPOR domain-containing protein, partial [Bacteroidales bacterium]
MKRITTILFLLTITLASYAQRDIVKSLQTDAPGQGKVTIHQDAQITALLMGGSTASPSRNGEKKELKRQGYRVQVYAGNN